MLPCSQAIPPPVSNTGGGNGLGMRLLFVHYIIIVCLFFVADEGTGSSESDIASLIMQGL